MKKLFCMFLVFVLLFVPQAQAEDYMYFSSGEMTLTDGIDTDRMAHLGGVYYAADRQGKLWMTQIFTDWILVNTAPQGCRLIAGNPKADKLVIYAQNTLFISYDGVKFTPIKELTQDTVVLYNCGLYTAMHKTESGFALEYSFDALNWYVFPAELTASTFTVLWVNENQIVLKGMQTADGTFDTILDVTKPEAVGKFANLVYDVLSDTLVDNAAYTGAKLIYADAPKNHFIYVFCEDAPGGYRYQIVRKTSGQINAVSAVIASKDLELCISADTLFFAKDGKSVDLVCPTGPWMQLNDETAFPVLRSACSVSEDVFFDSGFSTAYYCKNTIPLPLDRAGVEVLLNGCYLAFDSAPQIINDRTMVPLRAIAEALGCSVEFNDATYEITIRRTDGVVLTMTLGVLSATKTWADGMQSTTTLDAAPVIVNDRTLVPLRFISESLDLTTEWVADTKTVVLK